jgi:RNA polymerase sigma-B factor
MSSSPAEERARSHSGRLLLRMPKTLHAELAARSDKEGVSLNQYIVSALARAVSDDETAPVVADGGSRDRSLRTALMVNAFVVGLAAVTAIVILVVALH